MLFYDTETCGLYGMPVLLQYAVDDGDIKLWDIWRERIVDTLELIEWMMDQDVCGFNLAFDHFQLVKCYTTFSLYNNPDAIPSDHIDELAVIEESARFLDLCLKPKSACDIMLHARKGPYQSLMQRSAIRVKRIPTRLCEAVRAELEQRIELDGIYFSKRKDTHAPNWQIKNIEIDGEVDPSFKNIVLKFHPSGALKSLAQHALGVKDDFILKFTDIEVDPIWRPKEIGYAPFALAVGKPGHWNRAWPAVIGQHISHWAHSDIARKYGCDDVDYTRRLWKYFDCPEPGDDDSELACMVASSRWRGFQIDIEKFKLKREKALKVVGDIPTSPRVAKVYMFEVMDDTERLALKEGTGASILEAIAGKPDEKGQWDHNKGWLDDNGKPHPAAIRGRKILEARRAGKEVELCDKLIKAGRFHPSFKVIGTLSSRMSGTDKFNPQGVKADEETRQCFPLADFTGDEILCGGDFVSFEVVLAEAIYNDPKLRADLEAGKSIHGLFAEQLFDIPYADIMANKKTSTHYTDGKRGIFSQLYGGNEHTIADRLDVDIEIAEKASKGFMERYPGVKKAREDIEEKFCSMRQPGGIGSSVEWHEPADYMESLLGFRRYFTLENRICKALFDLANSPPKSWKAVRVKVRRRDRLQTASGAVQSALYAAAFNIQAQNMRQAANHQIQSSGAQITKKVQRRIWDLQPCGVTSWLVRTINVHDEIHVVTHKKHIPEIESVVHSTVESFRHMVPLIEIEWNSEEKSWADK